MPAPERIGTRVESRPIIDERVFQNGVVRVMVDVTPEFRQSPQGDVMLRGYIGGKEIEVVFPGTRRGAALQLAQRLRRSVDLAKASARAGAPKAADLRQKLQVDGVWRVRLLAERQGMPVRRFQLVAARWRYRGADGVVHVDGTMPYG